MFKILKKDKDTKARLGVLETPHGVVKTPSYVIVATYGQIKCLKPSDIKKTKIQIVISNTYHLWDKALKQFSSSNSQFSKRLEKSFILKKLSIRLPTMTDSGGFQVFSLRYPEKRVGKILKSHPNTLMNSNLPIRRNIKIKEGGVYFKINSKWKFLGPELSMKLQEKIGADIVFAFDECTSPLDSYEYNKKALERTHRWALRCLKASKRKDQMFFGIIQGGRFKNLRIKSAKFINSLPFDGIGIGGSFGKNEMTKTLKWIIPYLSEKKPRHLLGIGKIEDVFNAVENGIDLFDCVIPTREARHGRIYTKAGYYDVRKHSQIKPLQEDTTYDTTMYHKLKLCKQDSLEKDCGCPICKNKITRQKLAQLFRNKKTLAEAQRFATIHNVWFFNNLMAEIRKSINKNDFLNFKREFLGEFKS